jgi:hypothetical protein
MRLKPAFKARNSAKSTQSSKKGTDQVKIETGPFDSYQEDISKPK